LKPPAPVALLVALALVLAVGVPITWWLRPRLPEATSKDLPVLDKGQLATLLTYKRRCRTLADCEEPLRCTDDPRVVGWRCLASECRTDLQCQPGFMCTPFVYSDGSVARLCVVEGTQEEGEQCDDFPLKDKWGCRPGLICNSGFCGRPCHPNEPATCPEGYVCQEGTTLPACLPSCLRGGCPPEKQCVRIRGEFSVCATVRGQDCDKQPCAPGEECQRVPGRPWRAKVVDKWCAIPCSEEKGKLCPAGSACIDSYCARLCEEGAQGTCPPGERCARIFGPGEAFTACVR
jgi:hypothetical protein